MDIKITLDIREFEAALDAMGNAASGALEKAVMSGAFVAEAEIKKNIQGRGLVDTGNLLNSVQAVLESANNNTAWASVGPRGVVYAAIHEFGGTIRPTRGRFLVFEIDGELIFAGAVNIPARPYIRPAFDLHGNQMLETMAMTLWEAITGAVDA